MRESERERERVYKQTYGLQKPWPRKKNLKCRVQHHIYQYETSSFVSVIMWQLCFNDFRVGFWIKISTTFLDQEQVGEENLIYEYETFNKMWLLRLVAL